MTQQILNNVTVVIRTVDEDTLEACKQALLKQVNQKDVFIIKEKPFSNAVKKGFEIGISEAKTWTLMVDADLILLPNAIAEMIQSANNYDDKLYVYQGQILDKIRCGTKSGGPHLYRTENLKFATQFFNKMSNSIRPESMLYKEMESLGYKTITENKLFALHDFFQSNKDIYRKSFFHGIKHSGWEKLMPLWLEKGKNDIDYRIVIDGFIAGYYSDLNIYPSLEELNNRFEEYSKCVGVNEKIGIIEVSESEIQNILNEFKIQLNANLEVQKRKKSFKEKIIGKLKSKIQG